jgi:hypothetical protein
MALDAFGWAAPALWWQVEVNVSDAAGCCPTSRVTKLLTVGDVTNLGDPR